MSPRGVYYRLNNKKMHAQYLKRYPNQLPRLRLVIKLREEGKTFREIAKMIGDEHILSTSMAWCLYHQAIAWRDAGLLK